LPHGNRRLVEEADFRAAQELFGTAEQDVRLDDFAPKTAKDFEDFARAVAAKYLAPHSKSSHYKTLVKQIIKQALGCALMP
jgi:translation initiation factor 3 subunit J